MAQSTWMKARQSPDAWGKKQKQEDKMIKIIDGKTSFVPRERLGLKETLGEKLLLSLMDAYGIKKDEE